MQKLKPIKQIKRRKYSIDDIVVRLITSTGYNKKYQPRKTNPWFAMITPIINHKKWKDQDGNSYVFVDQRIAPDCKPFTDEQRLKWGQILYQCEQDNTYWRIGFDNLNKCDNDTIPDQMSSNEQSLQFVQYDLQNKTVVFKK